MTRNRRPQKSLPGMENRRLDELHQKLIELDAVRKQRMEFGRREIQLNDECRILMEKYEKKDSGYNIDGVHGEYTVKDPKVVIHVKIDGEALEEQETILGHAAPVSPIDGADFDLPAAP